MVTGPTSGSVHTGPEKRDFPRPIINTAPWLSLNSVYTKFCVVVQLATVVLTAMAPEVVIEPIDEVRRYGTSVIKHITSLSLQLGSAYER